MYIARVKSKGRGGKSYTSILLRESVRKGKRVLSRTVAVLTKVPKEILGVIEKALEGGGSTTVGDVAANSGGKLELRNGQSIGGIWVVNEIAQRIGIKKALGVTWNGELGYWQVLARVLQPGTSLLGMVRLASRIAANAVLGWHNSFTEDDLYSNGEWLEGRHAVIEQRLWEDNKKEKNDLLFLYDVTSSYMEGACNELADYGYNRDGKNGKKQVVAGLLTDEQGEPASIQVFRGNTSDVKTFEDQLNKIKTSFGCKEVVIVGDRGMIRGPQMQAANKAGFRYITAISKPQIEKLLKQGVFQLGLFDEKICEVNTEEGARYILRRNPVRKQEIADSKVSKQKSVENALSVANKFLAEHARAKVETQVKTISAKIKRLCCQTWLSVQVQDRVLSLKVDEEALAQDSVLDGCYVITTDLYTDMATAQVVHDRYKDLAFVERDFRTLKTGHLELRPWFVCKKDNTHAHALTAMLALKIRRSLEKSWNSLNITVEEGLRELDALSVVELVSGTSAAVVRQIPQPNSLQEQLLKALNITLPTIAPSPRVTVGTRKKIQSERQPGEI